MKTEFIKEQIFNAEPLHKREYKTRQLIGKHVAWIRKPDRPLIAKIAIAVLVAIECLVLTLTLFGTYFIYRGICEYLKQKKVEDFNKTEKGAPPDLAKLPLLVPPLPSTIPIIMRSKTASFGPSRFTKPTLHGLQFISQGKSL